MTRNVLVLASIMLATLASPAQARDLDTKSFRSPSGGIRCTMNAASLLCVVDTPKYANGAYGTLSRTDASVGSVDDFGAGNPKTVLRYGRSWSRGALRCTMRHSGITCRNRDGDGFQLSKRRQRTL